MKKCISFLNNYIKFRIGIFFLSL